MSSPKLNITADDLKDLVSQAVAAAVSEARKPVVTEEDLRKQEQARKFRRANAELAKQEAANRDALKRSCSHTRRDGSTRAVCVKAKEGNYMLCQFCQCRVRPGVAPEGRTDEGDVYDTALYNELFQKAGAADIFL